MEHEQQWERELIADAVERDRAADFDRDEYRKEMARLYDEQVAMDHPAMMTPRNRDDLADELTDVIG
jgi:hypothetical protein